MNNNPLVKLTGIRMFFNTETGYTYQMTRIDGEDLPCEIEVPTHLNDIETADWWLELTDDDWAVICQYNPALLSYCKSDIFQMYDKHYAPFKIEQIVDKSSAIPDNVMVYHTDTGYSEPYQDNDDFINNVVSDADTILYQQQG